MPKITKTPTWQEWKEFANDATHWQNHWERGLLKAQHIRDYILRLWFEEELDVTIYELDFAPLFRDQNPGGVFAVLQDPERFALVIGDYALAWLDPESGVYDERSIDIAPECIRFFCERYGTLIKAPGEAAHPERVAA
jgi:hypothetical protein